MGEEQLDIGSIAVTQGLMTAEALKECREDLRLMSERGLKMTVAQVLLGKGLLSREDLAKLERVKQAVSGEKRKLGPFELLARIGEGGMGTVYKVRDTRTGGTAALKILPVAYGQNAEFVERFEREARILKSLSHPNIVKALDFGQLDYGRARLHYIAMELVQGQSLRQKIDTDGPTTERLALEWLTDIARALQHAHHKGLVHRDMKPDNIFITEEGHAKLGDFGLARDVAEEASRLTRTGMFMGSVHYASPEQAEGRKDVGVRSDIYSLGAAFYHALTGHVPFEGGSGPAVLVKHLTEELPWPGDINPDVSDAVSELIAKMMAKKRKNRFQNPMQLLLALGELQAGKEVEEVLSRSAASSIARTERGRQRALQEHTERMQRVGRRRPRALDMGLAAAGLWKTFALGAVFIICLMALLWGVVLYNLFQGVLTDQIMMEGTQCAKALAIAGATMLVLPPEERHRITLGGLGDIAKGRRSDIATAAVFDEHGAAITSMPGFESMREGYPISWGARGVQVKEGSIRHGKVPVRFFYADIKDGRGRILGKAMVAIDWRKVSEKSAWVVRMIVVSGLLFVAIGVVANVALARYLGRPMRKL